MGDEMGYKRLNSLEDLMRNKNRSRIFHMIMEMPGASFTELRLHMSIKNGTLSHHLIKLEKEDLIRSKKIGVFRRYYPSNGNVPQDLEEKITDVVLINPGISQSMVARKLDITRQVANYHIHSLKRKGHLIVRRNGRSSELFLR